MSTAKRPLRPVTQLLISIAIIVLAVVAAIYLFRYPQKFGPFFIGALVITLATFLLLLLLRHFVLIWFSYLHQRELAKDDHPEIYPFVSIIVPAYNEEQVIRSSLSSLLELRYPYYEIIAVDDGSTDATYERMKEFEGNHYGVKVSVFRKENSGKADTLNYGVRRSTAPIVVCMDSDSRLTPEALRYAVRHFADKTVGAVAGNVKVANRHNIWTKLQALAGGALAVLGTPPATPIGTLRLTSDHGTSDNAFKLSETASPILARLNPGYEVPVRPAAVAFLKETPRMHIDARWRTNARAVAMHMEVSDSRVLWLGLAPDAIAQPDNAQIMLMLRTAFRWLDGQPVSDGAIGEPTQARTMTPDARRLARSERFAFSVERLKDKSMFGVRLANRGGRPIANPTVQVWLPPGVTQVALAGDWIMKRGATISGNQQDGACLISLPSLSRNEDRMMKLRIVATRR